ncbi:MAG: hypothetical protein Q8P67_25665 [archaeon]|nr:hypothetical protein [archaeon]
MALTSYRVLGQTVEPVSSQSNDLQARQPVSWSNFRVRWYAPLADSSPSAREIYELAPSFQSGMWIYQGIIIDS